MNSAAAKTVSTELSPSAKALLEVLREYQSGDYGPNREVSDAARRYNSHCKDGLGRWRPEFESFRTAANELDKLGLVIEERGHIRINQAKIIVADILPQIRNTSLINSGLHGIQHEEAHFERVVFGSESVEIVYLPESQRVGYASNGDSHWEDAQSWDEAVEIARYGCVADTD